MAQYSIGYSHGDGCLDAVSVEPAGLVRIEGWTTSDSIQDFRLPRCFVNGKELRILESFRAYRPDVAVAIGTENVFLGVVVLYRLPEGMGGGVGHLRLTYGDDTIFEVNDCFRIERPDYVGLLDAPDVLHREDIYGFGPPATTVLEEVKWLGKMVPAPILDFGCGSGVLVKALRAKGIEAYGIELDRRPIRENIPGEIQDYIHLYDGSCPLPFADEQFQSIIAIEVIEHIPKYDEVLEEIARITKRNFVMTVPDMSAIPICHHNHVVPWHLLESTHVNFFTQTSLERVLRRHFGDVQFARMSPTITNDSKWFESLIGICRK
jgi:2-polyprenyl-3-methyl-5-hydroxy-6-metoxy-1,4-benzoquinol methylase